MAVRLYSAILARNEAGADRYLSKILLRCLQFSDEVLLLDDRSTDRTAEIAVNLGAKVRVRKDHSPPAWGNEASAREELWSFGLEYATGPNDWLFIVDADHEVIGDPRELCQSREVNAWNWFLFDCWSDREYRSDGYWQAHTLARPWLFAPRRVPDGWTAQWSARGVHPGHAPLNFPYSIGVAPPETYRIYHWGWSKEPHRAAKHAAYLSQSHQLSDHEKAHAESILV